MNKIPIIIDVDTGTDDAICIAAALLHPEILEIKAFTSVCGNVTVDKTSQNTLNVVRFLRSGIPVAIGAEKPLVRELHPAISHGQSGLGDVALPAAEPIFHPEPACELIFQEACNAGGELQILAVGPLTNLALSIQKYPQVISLIKHITVMGGGLYGGNMTMTSEFNIYNDPEAAKIVFHSGIPLSMVGLDVTLKPKLPEAVVAAIAEMDTPHGILVSKIFDFMKRRKVEMGGDDPNLHDVIALAAVVCPSILTFTKFYMTVETEGSITRGMTVADFNRVEGKEENVWAATDIEVENFWTWFLETIQKSVNA